MVFPPDAIEVLTPKQARRVVKSLVSRDLYIFKVYEMIQPDVFSAIVEAAKKHEFKVAAVEDLYGKDRKRDQGLPMESRLCFERTRQRRDLCPAAASRAGNSR